MGNVARKPSRLREARDEAEREVLAEAPPPTAQDESFFGDAVLLDHFGVEVGGVEVGIGEMLRAILMANRLPLEAYAFLRAWDKAGWYLVKRDVAMADPHNTFVMAK